MSEAIAGVFPSVFMDLSNKTKNFIHEAKNVTQSAFGALSSLGHDMSKSARYVSSSASFLSKVFGASEKTAKGAGEAAKFAAIGAEFAIVLTNGTSLLTSKIAESLIAASGLTLAIASAGSAGAHLGAKIMGSESANSNLNSQIGFVSGLIYSVAFTIGALADGAATNITEDTYEFEEESSMVTAVGVTLITSLIARIVIERTIASKINLKLL